MRQPGNRDVLVAAFFIALIGALAPAGRVALGRGAVLGVRFPGVRWSEERTPSHAPLDQAAPHAAVTLPRSGAATCAGGTECRRRIDVYPCRVRCKIGRVMERIYFKTSEWAVNAPRFVCTRYRTRQAYLVRALPHEGRSKWVHNGHLMEYSVYLVSELPKHRIVAIYSP